MTRGEYLKALKHRLRSLPKTDARDAVEYYENYLNEAGDEEAEAITRLGTPSEVAALILAEYAVQEPEKEEVVRRRGFKSAWYIILAVFAAPIALPFAAAVFAVALALLISLFAVLVSLWTVGIAAILGGVAYIITGFSAFPQGIGTVLLFVGVGLFGTGAGALFLKAAIFLSKHGIRGIAKFVGKVILHKDKDRAGVFKAAK